MISGKDVNFNDATQTLTINGEKHHIGGGANTGRVVSHEFDTDAPFDIEASGVLIAWGYDKLADPSDDPGEFLYILSPANTQRVTGNNSVTFTKTDTGWRVTPSANSLPLIYFYIP